MRRFVVPLVILLMIAGSYTAPGRKVSGFVGGWFAFLDGSPAKHATAPVVSPRSSATETASRETGRLVEKEPAPDGSFRVLTDTVAAVGFWASGEAARGQVAKPDPVAGLAAGRDLRGIVTNSGIAMAAGDPSGAALRATPFQTGGPEVVSARMGAGGALCYRCTDDDPHRSSPGPC